MAITGGSSGWNDPYGGRDYYAEQERKYRAERERAIEMQRMMNTYNPYMNTYGDMTAQQLQEAKQVQEQKPSKAAQPEYLTNDKLLLLGEAS